MGIDGVTTARFAVSAAALELLRRQAREEASKNGEGLLVKRVDVARILGEEMTAALGLSVHEVIQGLRLERFGTLNWHFLCPDQRTNKAITAKDRATEIQDDIVSILLPLSGEGRVRVVPNSSPTTVRGSVIVQIGEQECMVYNGSIAYAISTPFTIFLHCVCSHVEIPSWCIYTPVSFACPYNSVLEPTEICAYPKQFRGATDPTAPACIYSARTWKNVLDHLTVCMFNPAVERRKERRRVANAQPTVCGNCGRVCPSGNALRQHKHRHHPVRGSSANKSELLSVFDAVIRMTSKRASSGASSQHTRPAAVPTLEELVSTMDTNTDDEQMCSLLLTPVPHLHDPLTELKPLTMAHAHAVVSGMLASVSKAEVRQRSRSRDQNASEITMDGVTQMVRQFGTLEPGDVFMDVGSGIGNVVIQVAVETQFASVVGIDMRDDLLYRSQALIDQHVQREQRLNKLTLIHATIGSDDVEKMPHVRGVTHIYCSNKLFSPEALLALEDLYWLPKVRVVVVTQKPCSRHSKRCTKPFCQFWRLERTITVAMTYTHLPVELFFYTNGGAGNNSVCLCVTSHTCLANDMAPSREDRFSVGQSISSTCLLIWLALAVCHVEFHRSSFLL